MSALMVLRVALRALARNKLRSFLTALGVVIGVAAVIAMVGIGDGAKARVEATFAAIGSNMLLVMNGSSSGGGAMGGAGSLPSLTWDDLKAIQTELSAVKDAAPVLRASAQVMAEELNWATSIQGTTPEFLAVRSWPVEQGSAFTQADVDGGQKVAVLGQTVVEKLFGANAAPVGQVVRVKNIPFTVVGVLAKKGQSPFGQDFDDVVLVPVSTFQQKIQGGLKKFLPGIIMASAIGDDGNARAQQQIRALLRDRHRLDGAADDDFTIRNPSEIASAQQAGTRIMTMLLAGIAFVSLIVGGIGIMNIMLVSVTERTREIGVRMAVGARARDIQLQFLVEALTLSLGGGLVGIALGVGGGTLLSSLAGFSMIVRPEAIVVAVAFSALVGVGFGFWPALKASRLDPITALRFE
ncbi:MAG TPA: ABC transporter permease [Anaeromyxobacteraceae bacterium]|nr:ABC transporter permease [Anaeromyxobacteraceae bacterium]